MISKSDNLNEDEIELIKKYATIHLTHIPYSSKISSYKSDIDNLIKKGFLLASKPNLIITRKLLKLYIDSIKNKEVTS